VTLTREQIMALRGPELDAAVAEHLMGWRSLRTVEVRGILGTWHRYQGIEPISNLLKFVPHYSSDIATAWQIVEQLEWPIDLHNCVHGEWACTVLCPYEDENGEPWVAAVAPTAPEAIIKAALLLKVAEAEGQRHRVETTCPKCQGRGYVHGFGEHGADPEWCPSCDGHGVIALDVRPSKNGVE